ENHIDKAMEGLGADRVVASKVLEHLVTKTRTKIAHDASDLASWAKMDVADVERVLERLEAPEMRVLRPVTDGGGTVRHEIFHDVLAPAIVEWRRREELEEERTRAEQKAKADLIKAALVFAALLLLLVGIAYVTKKDAENRQALAKERERSEAAT